MAYVYLTKRDDKYRVTVRQPGKKSTGQSFDRKADALAWKRDRETEIASGGSTSFGELRAIRVAQLLERFRDEVSPHRKGWRWEIVRLNALLRESWVSMPLTDDIAQALRLWRDARLAGRPGHKPVKGSSVNRDLNLLGGVFTHAIKEWGLKLGDNPVHQVKRPKSMPGDERDVIWTDADLTAMLEHLEFDPAVPPVSATSYVGWVLALARYTGLRLQNVCEVMACPHATRPWLDLSIPAVHYKATHTKQSVDYSCPLSSVAVGLYKQLLEHRKHAASGRLIEPPVGSIGTLFRRERDRAAEKRPALAKLRLHDLRHTWTTEMVPRVAAKGGDAMLMAKISGRRGTKSLFRYYNPKAKDMASYLD